MAIEVAPPIAVRLEIVRPVAVEPAAIDLVAREIAAVELPVAVTLARVIDLAARLIDLVARAIAAVVVVQIVLGVATLGAVLGIGASSKVQDPAAAVRAYLHELGLPEHDVHLDLARLRRLAIDAIAAMPDEELARAAGAPLEVVPVLRGARSLVEAQDYARLILSPERVELPDDAHETLERFAELRGSAPDRLDHEGARAIVRELKAVGGDLRALRLALTGAATGPELAAVLSALSRDEALARARRA